MTEGIHQIHVRRLFYEFKLILFQNLDKAPSTNPTLIKEMVVFHHLSLVIGAANKIIVKKMLIYVMQAVIMPVCHA